MNLERSLDRIWRVEDLLLIEGRWVVSMDLLRRFPPLPRQL